MMNTRIENETAYLKATFYLPSNHERIYVSYKLEEELISITVVVEI